MEQDACTVRVPTGYRVGGWCVEQPLASGSWSSVYSAARVDAEPGAERQEAALKFIATGTLTSRQLSHLADMTSREVAVSRHVDHPGLIRVLDVMVIDDPATRRSTAGRSWRWSWRPVPRPRRWRRRRAPGWRTRRGSSPRCAPPWRTCTGRAGCTAT